MMYKDLLKKKVSNPIKQVLNQTESRDCVKNYR